MQYQMVDCQQSPARAHMGDATAIANPSERAAGPVYLEALALVLHYAEHAEANPLDAHGYFGNNVAVAVDLPL